MIGMQHVFFVKYNKAISLWAVGIGEVRLKKIQRKEVFISPISVFEVRSFAAWAILLFRG